MKHINIILQNSIIIGDKIIKTASENFGVIITNKKIPYQILNSYYYRNNGNFHYNIVFSEDEKLQKFVKNYYEPIDSDAVYFFEKDRKLIKEIFNIINLPFEINIKNVPIIHPCNKNIIKIQQFHYLLSEYSEEPEEEIYKNPIAYVPITLELIFDLNSNKIKLVCVSNIYESIENYSYDIDIFNESIDYLNKYLKDINEKIKNYKLQNFTIIDKFLIKKNNNGEEILIVPSKIYKEIAYDMLDRDMSKISISLINYLQEHYGYVIEFSDKLLEELDLGLLLANKDILFVDSVVI